VLGALAQRRDSLRRLLKPMLQMHVVQPDCSVVDHRRFGH
jgi:hypothetical protein